MDDNKENTTGGPEDPLKPVTVGDDIKKIIDDNREGIKEANQEGSGEDAGDPAKPKQPSPTVTSEQVLYDDGYGGVHNKIEDARAMSEAKQD